MQEGPKADPMLRQGLEGDLVAGHVKPELSPARRRKAQTERRLRWLEARWTDESAFGRIAAAGRYLQLCMLTEWATELDAAAECRLIAEERGASA
jgi:hypothetical protein